MKIHVCLFDKDCRDAMNFPRGYRFPETEDQPAMNIPFFWGLMVTVSGKHHQISVWPPDHQSWGVTPSQSS